MYWIFSQKRQKHLHLLIHRIFIKVFNKIIPKVTLQEIRPKVYVRM